MVDQTQYWILFALLTSSASAFHQSRIASPASLRKWQRCRTTTLFEEAFKKGKRREEVKYVEWAGFNGLLPLQRYTNVMEKEAYNDWLCKQLPLVSETFTEDATMLDSNSSLKDQAESKAAQILDPLAALKPIYVDSHIVVVNKPSGALSGEKLFTSPQERFLI